MDIPPAITALTRLDGADLDERYRLLAAAIEAVPDLQKALSAGRAEAVREMKAEPGATWEVVGERIGLHYARASQIARGVSGGTKRRPPADQP
ncbi:hypothetical protein ACIBCR_16290 [Micromonospora echinospora]|uniref:hypothetical protein n=1 Tax=Micromonospora echinospora TaxID=1877 RepID=UPI00379F2BA2